jgi:hypothetical protein
LPKFKPEDYAQKTMLKLWQSFLTSINAKTGQEEISDELMANEEVKEALDLCRNLTEEERGYYDGFWGMEFLRKDRDMTVEKIGIEKGRAEGRAEGEKIGIEKGRAEGEKQKAFEIAKSMKSDGFPIENIIKYSGLTAAEIESL